MAHNYNLDWRLFEGATVLKQNPQLMFMQFPCVADLWTTEQAHKGHRMTALQSADQTIKDEAFARPCTSGLGVSFPHSSYLSSTERIMMLLCQQSAFWKAGETGPRVFMKRMLINSPGAAVKHPFHCWVLWVNVLAGPPGPSCTWRATGCMS